MYNNYRITKYLSVCQEQRENIVFILKITLEIGLYLRLELK